MPLGYLGFFHFFDYTNNVTMNILMIDPEGSLCHYIFEDIAPSLLKRYELDTGSLVYTST